MLAAFLMVSDLYIPEIKHAWSCCMILLIHWWVLFASTVFRIFASIFISEIGLYFPLSGFDIKYSSAS